MTDEQLSRAEAALRFLGPVWDREMEVFHRYREQGLAPEESIRRTTADIVEEFGDRLVAAIHDAMDARIRTRAGAVRFLRRRGWVDLRTRHRIQVSA